MSTSMPSRFSREAFLGAANNARGMVNTTTLAVAFVLSIMVINNYRQCRAPNNKSAGSGYGKNSMLVDYSYYLSVIVLIAAVLLFALDLAKMAKIIK
jgi:hypothetical protein